MEPGTPQKTGKKKKKKRTEKTSEQKCYSEAFMP